MQGVWGYVRCVCVQGAWGYVRCVCVQDVSRVKLNIKTTCVDTIQ